MFVSWLGVIFQWHENKREKVSERLRELELFSLEEWRLQGDLVGCFQYLKRVYKKDGERKFTRACSDRTRGMASNGETVGLDSILEKNIYCEGWGIGMGGLEKFWMPHPCKSSMPDWMELWVTWSRGRCSCLWKGFWAKWSFKVPSHSNHSMILLNMW